MRRETHRAAIVLLLALTAALAAARAASGADPPTPPTAEGLWRGLLLIEPAVVEVEFGVELARAPDGRWTGTYDDPDRGLRHEVLDHVSVDDRRVEIAYTFEIPGGEHTIPYRWTGELADDGGSLAGEMVEGEGPPVPFVLHRLGPPGTEPPAPPAVPVVALSPEAAALREAFNRDRGRVRLLMLLSPKCSRCLSGAGIVGRRVLPQAGDGELAVLVVWGPMFGQETLEDARAPRSVSRTTGRPTSGPGARSWPSRRAAGSACRRGDPPGTPTCSSLPASPGKPSCRRPPPTSCRAGGTCPRTGASTANGWPPRSSGSRPRGRRRAPGGARLDARSRPGRPSGCSGAPFLTHCGMAPSMGRRAAPPRPGSSPPERTAPWSRERRAPRPPPAA